MHLFLCLLPYLQLKSQHIQREEEKLSKYEKRLARLNRKALAVGGQIVAEAFYHVLQNLNQKTIIMELSVEEDINQKVLHWVHPNLLETDSDNIIKNAKIRLNT